jgi:hypothetical protein
MFKGLFADYNGGLDARLSELEHAVVLAHYPQLDTRRASVALFDSKSLRRPRGHLVVIGLGCHHHILRLHERKLGIPPCA